MIEDFSEESKKLFNEIVRKDASGGLYKVLQRIMNNPRNQIDWGSVYYDIVSHYPEFDDSITTSIESVDESLVDFCGISGFCDELEENGFDVSAQYSFNELWDLLWEYNERYHLDLFDDQITNILRKAFNRG